MCHLGHVKNNNNARKRGTKHYLRFSKRQLFRTSIPYVRLFIIICSCSMSVLLLGCPNRSRDLTSASHNPEALGTTDCLYTIATGSYQSRRTTLHSESAKHTLLGYLNHQAIQQVLNCLCLVAERRAIVGIPFWKEFNSTVHQMI